MPSSRFDFLAAAGGFEIVIGNKPCDDPNFKKYVSSAGLHDLGGNSALLPGLDGDVPATFFLVTVQSGSRFNSDGCELGTLIGLRSTRTTHDEQRGKWRSRRETTIVEGLTSGNNIERAASVGLPADVVQW